VFKIINRKYGIKMEKECAICCQADYFEISLWGEVIRPKKSLFSFKI
jgi:hypothetical protein